MEENVLHSDPINLDSLESMRMSFQEKYKKSPNLKVTN